MNPQFNQAKKIVNIEVNKQSIARNFGVGDNEVCYAKPGQPLTGYKVIYDKDSNRAYSLPALLPTDLTVVSFSPAGILTVASGSIDLGALAVTRNEYVTLPGTFTTGATLTCRNELLSDNNVQYLWEGVLPKVVPTNTTPALTGGIGDGKWVPIGSDLLRAELIEGFQDILVEQPKSQNFWIDVHPDAQIHRINDRVLIGAAAGNDGKITTEYIAANKDWLDLIRNPTTTAAQFCALSTIGQGAVIGGSRTSDNSLTGSLGSIGIQGWGINDNTVNVQTTYAAYFESRRMAGAGTTHGFEVDVINFGNSVNLQPFNMFQDGLTAGQWVASGGELNVTPASVAIAIINNGSTWNKGILFHSTSIQGTDGVSGQGSAIEMAIGHTINWMFGNGRTAASVTSSVNVASASQNLNFSNGGLLFRNAVNTSMLQVLVSDTYVNGILVTPANAGTGPAIGVQGTDTNIDLRLTTKGTGVLNITNPVVTGTAGAAAGFLTVKLNGVSYKLQYFGN